MFGFPDERALELDAQRRFAFFVDEGGKPRLLLLQGGKIGLRPAMRGLALINSPRARNSRRSSLSSGRAGVKPSKRATSWTGMETLRKHGREIALVHDDMAGHAVRARRFRAASRTCSPSRSTVSITACGAPLANHSAV